MKSTTWSQTCARSERISREWELLKDTWTEPGCQSIRWPNDQDIAAVLRLWPCFCGSITALAQRFHQRPRL